MQKPMTIFWKVSISKSKHGGSFRYFKDIPTVGEVVDFILCHQGEYGIEDVTELAAEYVKVHRDDNRHNVTLGLGIGLDKPHVGVVAQRLEESYGRDYDRSVRFPMDAFRDPPVKG